MDANFTLEIGVGWGLFPTPGRGFQRLGVFMKKYLVNYATPEFYQSQKRLNRSARKFGLDQVISYREKHIRKTSFYQQNQYILNNKRGGRYWIWKPYIILETLRKVSNGSLVFYLDSGAEIIRDIYPLINLCVKQDGILLFTIPRLNKHWTKRDCFVMMNCDLEEYYNTCQVPAGYQVYIKNDRSINFVQEYLDYCQNINIVTDLPNVCGLDNLPEFREHRHDQSILSLLAFKHEIELFRNPSQWGNSRKLEEFREPGEFGSESYSNVALNSPYPTLINLHRERNLNPTFRSRIKSQLSRLKQLLQ